MYMDMYVTAGIGPTHYIHSYSGHSRARLVTTYTTTTTHAGHMSSILRTICPTHWDDGASSTMTQEINQVGTVHVHNTYMYMYVSQ